jgi:Family of unknown function (DUF6325)
MALGPIEIVVIEFPGNRFTGEIIPELERLMEQNTISIIDGLFLHKDAVGDVTFVELDEIGLDDDAAALASLIDEFDELITDDDVDRLAAGLDLDCSAAILVFEHTWSKPLRDAIVNSGGILAASFRVPGRVVDEVMAALAESN